MRIAVLGFTRAGGQRLAMLVDKLAGERHQVTGFLPTAYLDREACGDQVLAFPQKPSDWVREQFHRWDGLVFVGAVGIAVRFIAPCLIHKSEDPAVVVLDESGEFAISILSGHLGGANELALTIAKMTGAKPVITTATDLNGMFAVDVFARKNRLSILDYGMAKQVSAALLDGGTVGVFSDFPVRGTMPAGLLWGLNGKTDIHLTIYEPEKPGLVLTPPVVTVGVGCRKGVESSVILDFLESILREQRIRPESIAKVATISLKGEEPGVIQLCRKLGVELAVFSPEELAAVSGEFSESAFVRRTTGVGNVCERAAVLGAENGRLLLGRRARDGVTLALAAGDYSAAWQ